jgi:hypothetical protein
MLPIDWKLDREASRGGGEGVADEGVEGKRVIEVRLSSEWVALLQHVAKVEGTTMSILAARAVRFALPKWEKIGHICG